VYTATCAPAGIGSPRFIFSGGGGGSERTFDRGGAARVAHAAMRAITRARQYAIVNRDRSEREAQARRRFLPLDAVRHGLCAGRRSQIPEIRFA
jgi:hypothetical protein